MKIRIIKKKWWIPLPLPGYDGITIYPFIFLRPGWSESLLRHELIHCHQVRTKGWFKFYALYLLKWLRYGYRRHPDEKEAYHKQRDPEYLPPELEKLVHADG